jgi:predicted GNAT family acetyltransferase
VVLLWNTIQKTFLERLLRAWRRREITISPICPFYDYHRKNTKIIEQMKEHLN